MYHRQRTDWVRSGKAECGASIASPVGVADATDLARPGFPFRVCKRCAKVKALEGWGPEANPDPELEAIVEHKRDRIPFVGQDRQCPECKAVSDLGYQTHAPGCTLAPIARGTGVRCLTKLGCSERGQAYTATKYVGTAEIGQLALYIEPAVGDLFTEGWHLLHFGAWDILCHRSHFEPIEDWEPAEAEATTDAELIAAVLQAADCPKCHGEPMLLGTLGVENILRCKACGWTWHCMVLP